TKRGQAGTCSEGAGQCAVHSAAHTDDEPFPVLLLSVGTHPVHDVPRQGQGIRSHAPCPAISAPWYSEKWKAPTVIGAPHSATGQDYLSSSFFIPLSR